MCAYAGGIAGELVGGLLEGSRVRAKYFNVAARQLKNPTQWHQGRIWVLVKILVPRGRDVEVISR